MLDNSGKHRRSPQDVLLKLQSPNLDYLSIAGYRGFNGRLNMLPALSSCLCSSTSKLRKLYVELGNLYVPAHQLYTLLRGLPKLRDLTIGWSKLDDDGIEVVNRNLNPETCPHLTELSYLPCFIPLVAVDKMVRSRVELSTGNFNSLQKFNVASGRWVDEDGDLLPEEADHPALEALEKDYPSMDIYLHVVGDDGW
ncbi:hypothetical protein M422DRAFT_52591 [Sphaerobolus stellatus SS14]|uniref:F-box domain-containing protein n=1 Tax=Sphaerobolus stellatus (strain SS14) TaxID=990650 RepID=A0A0C9UE40_SPHS4|nr:hypothetical protein M422DRAFT_52591 [Sphaerobolus stellatus SS14]